MDAADVTGPGTAPMVRPRAAAWFAVVSDPDRTPASTTTVAAVVAAISRLRARKRQRVGAAPGATSLAIAPPRSAIRAIRSLCPAG